MKIFKFLETTRREFAFDQILIFTSDVSGSIFRWDDLHLFGSAFFVKRLEFDSNSLLGIRNIFGKNIHSIKTILSKFNNTEIKSTDKKTKFEKIFPNEGYSSAIYLPVWNSFYDKYNKQDKRIFDEICRQFFDSFQHLTGKNFCDSKLVKLLRGMSCIEVRQTGKKRQLVLTFHREDGVCFIAKLDHGEPPADTDFKRWIFSNFRFGFRVSPNVHFDAKRVIDGKTNYLFEGDLQCRRNGSVPTGAGTSSLNVHIGDVVRFSGVESSGSNLSQKK